MAAMFSYCKKLINLDLSSFITNKVKSFSYTFLGCSELLSLNIININTSSAETMIGML